MQSRKKLQQVEGNIEAIQVLETYLAEARKGTVSFAGVFTVEGHRFSANYAGDLKSFHAGFFALDYMQNRMRNLANLQPLHPDDSEGPANKFVYDLRSEPLCHDFLVWLVTAEMIRRREGASPPLRIGFIKERMEERQNSRFYENVMRPAVDMFGAVEDPICFEGRRLRIYAPAEICEGARRGEEVPRITVPETAMGSIRDWLKGGVCPVTITLRETGSFTHRNSNLTEWCKFARWLEAQGEQVIFLRDSDKADEPLEGFRTFPAGSNNAFMRAALYEQSKCNCFVSNGPLGWALFGSKPFLAFHTVVDDEPSECNTPAWWDRFQGIVPGEQYPWCGPQQRMVYADDNFENMRAAWLEHMHINARDVQLMGELLDAVG